MIAKRHTFHFLCLSNSIDYCVQAESVRKAEEERMKQEAKEAALRAAKERLDRLQATWREDQHLKEVRWPQPLFAQDAALHAHARN